MGVVGSVESILKYFTSFSITADGVRPVAENIHKLSFGCNYGMNMQPRADPHIQRRWLLQIGKAKANCQKYHSPFKLKMPCYRQLYPPNVLAS